MNRNLSVMMTMTLFLALVIPATGQAGTLPHSTPTIQLYGGGPFDTGSVKYLGQNGFSALFNSNSDWGSARKDISSFEINTQFAVWGDDTLLRKVFAYLKAYNIPLALEGLMMPNVGGVGAGVEGFSGQPGEMGRILTRIKMLGGDLTSISMDEPLYFGHQSNQVNAPQWSIEQLAENVATNVKAAREIFPDIKIGDIEPIQYTQNLEEWISTYQKVTGIPLAFVKADLNYIDPTWLSYLEQTSNILTKNGIPLSVIFDGNSNDTSNISSTNSALQDFIKVITDPNIKISQAVVQSWLPYPTQLLPDYKPGTSTNLVVNMTNAEFGITTVSEPGSFAWFVFFVTCLCLFGRSRFLFPRVRRIGLSRS